MICNCKFNGDGFDLSIPEPSPDLVNALKDGRAIAIVGSGLSIQVGGPRWEDLLYGILAEACETRPDESDRIKAAFQEIKDNHLLVAAALLKSVLGAGFPNAVVRQIDCKRKLLPRKEIKETDNICDALFEICGKRESRILIPSINHRMITQLPFRAIITTNYDRLLEKAITVDKVRSVFTRSYPYLPKRVVESKWFLLKVHGCIGTPEDIILSRDDYRKALFGEPLHEVLDSLFKTNEKFWLGYGHNDPTLDFLVDECKEKLHLKGGFAVARKQNYALQNRFETADIQPSWLDDYEQISGYLRKLAEATNSPLIFEIIIKCDRTGEQEALFLGNRVAEALSKLGGDFALFRVENGSVRMFLETRAATLTEFRERLSEKDPEILKLIKQFHISSFDGLDTTNLVDNEIAEVMKTATEGAKYVKHSFPVPRQIPPPPRDFKGREKEIADILFNFEKGATITGLRGMGGVGKTALALVVADRLKNRYPDGQLFINLHGTRKNATSSSEAMTNIIHAFLPNEMLPENQNELKGMYLSVLAGKRALLLLDNASSKEQIEPLLPPKGIATLITSRNKFILPGLNKIDLDVLSLDEACELLLEISERIGDMAQGLAELCGYHPLALRNAASVLSEREDISVNEYQRQLKDKRALLELIDASFSLSYDLLPENRRQQWCCLSIFPDDFDRDGAAAIVGAVCDYSAQSLSDLVKWSLVDFTPSASYDGGRYKLHDLARIFAESRLEPDLQAAARRVHAQYYFGVLSKAKESYTKGNEIGLELFDREIENIQSGLSWAENMVHSAQNGNNQLDESTTSILYLASHYPIIGAPFFDFRQHPRIRIKWHEKALIAAKMNEDQFAEGANLSSMGRAYADLGMKSKAIEYYQRSLDISHEMGNRYGEAVSLAGLGRAYSDLRMRSKSIECHERALSLAHETGNRRGEATSLGDLGRAYFRQGETSKAIEYSQRSLDLAREMRNLRGEAASLADLGRAYSKLGETNRAIECLEEALDIAHEIGHRSGESAGLAGLGIAYADLGEISKAIECLEKALDIAHEVGNRYQIQANIASLVKLMSKSNERSMDIGIYERALAMARKIKSHGQEIVILSKIAAIYIELGETTKSMEYYRRALKVARQKKIHTYDKILREIGIAYAKKDEIAKAIRFYEEILITARAGKDHNYERAILSQIGLSYAKLGETYKAIEYFKQALSIARGIGDQQNEMKCLHDIGSAYFKLGEPKRAISFYEQALMIASELGNNRRKILYNVDIGLAYASLNDIHKAIENFEKSLASICNIACREDEGISFFNMSLALHGLEENEKAINYAKQALNIFQQNDSPQSEKVRQMLAIWGYAVVES